MRKLTIMVIFIGTLCMMTLGCAANRDKTPISNENKNIDSSLEEIKNPVVNWWKLYKNINKTNCVTLQVSNPNKFPIQFSYDLVYYKNNEVVKTESHWAMTGIEAGKTGIIYGDINIPSSDVVDRIELENIEVSKFEWKILKSTFKKSFIDKDVQYFDVKFNEKPRHTEIWVVLYNDLNKDKKVQANEFVQMGLLAPFVGIYETDGKIQIPISDEKLSYTDYEIYCFVFTMKNAN